MRVVQSAAAVGMLILVVPNTHSFLPVRPYSSPNHPSAAGSSAPAAVSQQQQQGHLLFGQNTRQFTAGSHDTSRTNEPEDRITTTNSTLSYIGGGIRLNKVLKATHSRRQADALIQEGRVTVNLQPNYGTMVRPFVDVVHLDGVLVEGWEALNHCTTKHHNNAVVDNDHNNNNNNQSSWTVDDDNAASTGVFEYVKYWKPRGIICTTDRRIPGNVLDAMERTTTGSHSHYNHSQHRIFPVGRLDKDTTGLLLLTNNGRLPNAFLRAKEKRPKVYQVLVDRPLLSRHVEQLRTGVVITTIAQRDGRRYEPLTAMTKPCRVRRMGSDQRAVEMTLYEGRNRQIRKMMASVGGYEVMQLHRVSFGGISLEPIKGPGGWQRVTGPELELIHRVLQESAANDSTYSSIDPE